MEKISKKKKEMKAAAVGHDIEKGRQQAQERTIVRTMKSHSLSLSLSLSLYLSLYLLDLCVGI